jgi:hypothetical protein
MFFFDGMTIFNLIDFLVLVSLSKRFSVFVVFGLADVGFREDCSLRIFVVVNFEVEKVVEIIIERMNHQIV